MMDALPLVDVESQVLTTQNFENKLLYWTSRDLSSFYGT